MIKNYNNKKKVKNYHHKKFNFLFPQNYSKKKYVECVLGHADDNAPIGSSYPTIFEICKNVSFILLIYFFLSIF